MFKIIEEIEDMPQAAQDVFHKHDSHIAEFLLPVRLMFPELPLSFHRRIRSDPTTAYEDDGNTRCSGTTYGFLWVVPIHREFRNPHDEWQDWRNNGGSCGMYFSLNFDLRNSDNRLRYSPNLCLSVAPMRLDTEKRRNGNRVEPFVCELGLTRIGLFINQIKQEQVMLAIAKDAIEKAEILTAVAIEKLETT